MVAVPPGQVRARGRPQLPRAPAAARARAVRHRPGRCARGPSPASCAPTGSARSPSTGRDPRAPAGRRPLPRAQARRRRRGPPVRRHRPDGRVGGRRVAPPQARDGDARRRRARLLLVPSVFVWPRVVAVVDPAWPPTVVYPARGIGTLWDPGRAAGPEALAALLGAGRAAVLAALHEPWSTRPGRAARGLGRRGLAAPAGPARGGPGPRPPRRPHGPLPALAGGRHARRGESRRRRLTLTRRRCATSRPTPPGRCRASVWENVQRCPAGSSAGYWRSPYSKSVGSMRIVAPCARACSQWARASSTRTMTACVSSPGRAGGGRRGRRRR